MKVLQKYDILSNMQVLAEKKMEILALNGQYLRKV